MLGIALHAFDLHSSSSQYVWLLASRNGGTNKLSAFPTSARGQAIEAGTEPRQSGSKTVLLTECGSTSVDLYLPSEGWGQDPWRFCNAGSCDDTRREIAHAGGEWLDGIPAETLHKGWNGRRGHGGERGRGEAPRDEGAACTREQVALLFTISTAGLSHDFARYSQLCKTSTITVVTTRVAVGVKGENSPEAPLTELSSYNLTIIMIIWLWKKPKPLGSLS